jgi:hypothetical protein
MGVKEELLKGFMSCQILESFKCRVPCGPFVLFTSPRVRIRQPQSENSGLPGIVPVDRFGSRMGWTHDRESKEGLAGRRGASALVRHSVRLANDERLRQQMSSNAEERRMAFESAVFDGHVGRKVQESLRWIATPPRSR